MYSIVMMTALTAAPDAPQFNGYFRDLFSRDSNSGCSGCSGCNGCSGAARYSCSGGCCGSTAYTTSCSGCCGSSCCGGGVFGLGLGTRVRSWFEPTGSGCCGGHSYSCSGSVSSCFGGAAYSYTPVFNGGLSCQGGLPYSAPPPMFDTSPGMPGAPGIPYAVPDPAPGMTGLRPAGNTNSALVSNGPTARAAVVVRIPADARLFADGRALNLTGAERKFVSPELPTNQEFIYRFKAEYERDGEMLSVTKKVTVRGGTTVMVEFTDLTAAAKPSGTAAGTATANASDKTDKGTTPVVKPVAQEPVKAEPVIKPAPASNFPTPPVGDRATITVKLPPGATLYVDDRRSPSQEPVRSFATPPLPAGREFAYLLKAEVVRNGQPETLTQKVPFRAGERVVVDFTSLGR
jgi:uncharacterized protein (TIGR03000 family)